MLMNEFGVVGRGGSRRGSVVFVMRFVEYGQFGRGFCRLV